MRYSVKPEFCDLDYPTCLCCPLCINGACKHPGKGATKNNIRLIAKQSQFIKQIKGGIN